MDGLLIVDKPAGPTSHDVVARVRRLSGERRIGHTGTLDPMASGVLPLLLGKATRLARFYSANEKRYEAVVRLGVSTDTHDADGQQIGAAWTGPWPEPATVDAALDRFRGRFMQQPPAYSAKKIDGQRSYRLARSHRQHASAAGASIVEPPPLPPPVAVHTSLLHMISLDGAAVVLDVVCSAGFYVRSLAHDLGTALGTGGHLAALRRTASGSINLEGAVSLTSLEGDDRAARIAAALRPFDALLPELPAVVLTVEGCERVRQGRDVAPAHLSAGAAGAAAGEVRLLSPDRRLLAIGAPGPTPGLLHPAIVLV